MSVVPVGRDGRVDPDEVLSLVEDDTCLVSVILVQNEIGSIEPCAEIGAGLAKLGAQGAPDFT